MTTRLLTLLLLVAGPNAQAQDIETCRLVTKADVASAIGRSATEGLKDAGKLGEAAFSHCTYKEGDKTLVLATVYTYSLDKAELQRNFETARRQANDAEIVTGLGDNAYWWKSKTTLIVLKDKYMVTVTMGPSVARLEGAKALAAKVVRGLPGA